MKTSSLRAPLNTVCSALFVSLVFPALMYGSELHVGAASVDITPNKAVALTTALIAPIIARDPVISCTNQMRAML